MADIADAAQVAEQAIIDDALARTKAAARRPKGQCYNCESPLDEPLIYCDADCGEDHRKRLHMSGGR